MSRIPNTLSRRGVITGLAAAIACPALASPARRSAEALVAAARRQVGVTLAYDPDYSKIGFPNGDVQRSRGVCTDVVIRAYRDAFGLDLQALVNADMRRAFGEYPHLWGLRAPDPSIDHRRVPNLRTFLARQGARLPIPAAEDGWQPGDIFTSLIDRRLPHIGFVSDLRPDGRPGCIIHNIGAGAHEEVALFDYPVTGRYRWALDA